MNSKDRSEANYSTLAKTMMVAPAIPAIVTILYYFAHASVEPLALIFVSALALIVSVITMVIEYHRFTKKVA